MVVCSRCKKRPAVVFVTRMDGTEQKNEGLCLKCARELNLPNVDGIMKQLGLNDEDIDSITEHMDELMAEVGEDGEDSFMPGGAPSMEFFNRMVNKLSKESDDGAVEVPPETGATDAKPKEKKKGDKLRFLTQYCQNLTQQARDGSLDNVIGRDKEMLRVMQILNRRTKNNPCLIGEPGVGKTAIAEGLAQKIVKKEVPAKLADKELYLLDLTSLVAGTQFRGQFESRVRGLLEEVKRVGNVILVIDEIHNLVGTGGDQEGTMNAANMLKPALSRGEVQVIGATTLNEYRKHIEKDAALERRFQPVMVNEPSIEDTVEILRGIKNHYETYHNIKVPMLIVERAVELSERYVNDRFLPDKAIDLIDEACSNATLKNPKYSQFFHCTQELRAARAELEGLENAEEKSEADYARIAEVKAKECRLAQQVKQLGDELNTVTVTFDDLATVIELWTGIPATTVKASEYEKLKDLEKVLNARIVGQDRAIEAIANAVRRSRVSLVPRRRPVSFIFTGPTGVGKTELVKVLSQELFNSPETLIRLDMSEFMEKHSVSRIIGSPPGYVGYDEAGQLTEKIRRKPYSVILFDEIEKAHPDVLNILLQVLDDGKITDAHGRSVSFEHTIIVMTSNAGSNIKGGVAGFNKTASMLSSEKSKKALGEFLRPEFLNRVDEIITFDPLPEALFPDIVRIYLSDLQKGLSEKEITLVCDDAAVQLLAKMAYSAEYGARNVRRIVQREIEDAVVHEMCNTDFVPTHVHVLAESEKIKIELK